MGARAFRIMALEKGANPGGRHASTRSYGQPPPSPSVGYHLLAGARPAFRLQAEGHGPHALGRVADRRRRGHFDSRYVSTAHRSPVRGGDPQDLSGLFTRVRRTVTREETDFRS